MYSEQQNPDVLNPESAKIQITDENCRLGVRMQPIQTLTYARALLRPDYIIWNPDTRYLSEIRTSLDFGRSL